ncbi:quinol monooxygenase YgiN [Kribbella aluminosa]|uniref:Quinol monooxygenase YgiN n=1 Tax=Kribbella aluminosa TaxID=416017 RepID=A0ABS4UJC7_9ACTN|nr:antibiotic biosynthesis monooxygenase [Kribbella aluminosa]MBP2351770.1 quinol monooxygenase YgiN [Kribbella aluminosa]
MGHVVIATWKTKPGEREKVMDILAEMTPGNRAEPKMVHFQAQLSTADPDTIILYEQYTDPSGYEDHRATEAFQTRVLGEAIPLLAERNVQTFTTIDGDSTS